MTSDHARFLRRTTGIAVLVALVDELVKITARSGLEQCASQPLANCDKVDLLGPLWLVRWANAGSALGFSQGLWLWIVLAAGGVLLIAVYARGVGLQLVGAAPNLLDRLAFGGASDVLHIGGQLTWNLADIALAAGTPLATWALARRLVPLTS